MTVSVTWIY